MFLLTDFVTAHASNITATFWWLGTTMVMLAAMLLHAETLRAPWWLVAVTAAEAYASFRRVMLKMTYSSSTTLTSSASSTNLQQQQQRKQPQRRLRHFTSVRLAEGAPTDEIVARFLALDAMSEVHRPSPYAPQPMHPMHIARLLLTSRAAAVATCVIRCGP